MQPYEPGSSCPNIVVPTLFIAAERDTLAAVASNAFVHYNSVPASTTKIYFEAAGADHYYSTDRFEASFEMNARYAIAFLKVYLEGDTRYETHLYGAEHQAVASSSSRYLTSP
jgi:triacylglycerol lipase